MTFRCDICSTELKSRMQLKEHKQTAHGVSYPLGPGGTGNYGRSEERTPDFPGASPMNGSSTGAAAAPRTPQMQKVGGVVFHKSDIRNERKREMITR